MRPKGLKAWPELGEKRRPFFRSNSNQVDGAIGLGIAGDFR
jgi:hypothetical protein